MASQTPTVEAVRGALKEVIEPVLGRDIVSLGMAKKIDIDGGVVYITIELPTPLYRDRAGLERAVENAAKRAPGAKDVRVVDGDRAAGDTRGGDATARGQERGRGGGRQGRRRQSRRSRPTWRWPCDSRGAGRAV